MPTLPSSQKAKMKSLPAKRPKRVAPSRPSATPTKIRKASQQELVDLFQRYYPDAHCALDHETPFQLLVATILSAQCTDERVNQVTPALFAQYPSAIEMAKAKTDQVELLIHSTGFYRNKAKNLISCARSLVEKYQGHLPRTLDQLVELAGVGRKTANVVMGNAYGLVSGIVVDTHVARLSHRFGWSKSANPEVIERDLQKIIPKAHWIMLSHWLITHGRQVCKARKPRCEKCFLSEMCPQIL